MGAVPDDVFEMACDVSRRFSDDFIAAWAANDGLRAGVLVHEVAATAILEERMRAARAAVQH